MMCFREWHLICWGGPRNLVGNMKKNSNPPPGGQRKNSPPPPFDGQNKSSPPPPPQLIKQPLLREQSFSVMSRGRRCP